MMKRLFLIFAVCALCAACGDDDPTAPDAGVLPIVRSDLLFDPQGRTGSIEVAASGDVTAELPSTWCSASVQGRVVSVTVADNTSFEGRTAVLTLRADGRQVQVPVQQRGMALGSLSLASDHIGTAGGRLSYFIRHDLPIALTTDDGWIHPRMEGDSLVVDCDASDTWHLRRGTLRYECAGYGGQLTITQYDLDTILGEYIFGGSMGSASAGFHFNLVRSGGNYYMVFFTVADWASSLVPVDFDERRCELTFHSATTIYENNSSSYVYYFFSDKGVANTPTATMKAALYYNPVMGTHYAPLEDTGSWENGPLTGFLLRMNGLVPANIIQLNDRYIQKVLDSE